MKNKKLLAVIAVLLVIVTVSGILLGIFLKPDENDEKDETNHTHLAVDELLVREILDGTKVDDIINDARVNYITPPREIGCYPGRSTDMGEDFEDWEMYQLREKVKLVREFDKLCDDILKTVIDLIENYEVEEQIVMKPHTVKVLREVAS